MPGVYVPQSRVQGGLLSQLGQVAQTAGEIYGIKHSSDMADIAQQNAALNQAKADREQQAFDDSQAGVFTPKEQVALGRNYRFVPGDTPNALPIKVRQGPEDDNLQDVYILPKSPMLDHVSSVNDAMVGGKHGTAMYAFDPETGAPKQVGFVETSKPEKVATPHIQAIGNDANGQIIGLDTTTGKTMPLGGGNLKGQKTPASLDPNAPPDPKAVAAERKQLSDLFLKGGQRSEIGRLKTKIDGAEALETLLNNHPDFMVNPQLQTELAMGTVNLVSPGTATQAMVEHMDPQTRGTFIANLMQKLTDQPYSANNPEFVKQFAETIAREKATAQDQIGRSVQQAQYAAPNFFKADRKGFFGLTGTKESDFTQDQNNDLVYQARVLGKKLDASGQPGGGGGTAYAGPQLAPTKSGYMPGSIVMVKGQHYQIAPDGDTLLPVKGP